MTESPTLRLREQKLEVRLTKPELVALLQCLDEAHFAFICLTAPHIQDAGAAVTASTLKISVEGPISAEALERLTATFLRR